jgi:hypothetical protein
MPVDGSEPVKVEEEVLEPIAYTRTLKDDLIDRLRDVENTDFFNYGKAYYKKTILNSDKAALKYCETLLDKMRKKGKKNFEDPDFGPKYKGDVATDSIYFGDIPKGYPQPKNMEWCRPGEITSKKPEFVDQGADTNDVIQGALGDCWFIGALSVLATDDPLLRGSFDKSKNEDGLIDNDEAAAMTSGVYPPMFHYLRKYGMYVFRFYKNNGWRYVIIDDRLPCYKKSYGDKELVFGRCRSNNEFWVPLIEKAYAKIHQCYEALISGFIDDGLTDMTAYAQTKIIFKKKGSNKIKMPTNGQRIKRTQEQEKTELWKLLVEANRNRSLMGASAFGPTGHEAEFPRGSFQPCGVLQGHAYSIIDVFSIDAEVPSNDGEGLVKKTVKLMRLRNPWGKKEWSGAWSDGSDEILDNMKALNAYVR